MTHMQTDPFSYQNRINNYVSKHEWNFYIRDVLLHFADNASCDNCTYISQTMVRLFEKNDWPWKTVREFIISLNPNGSKVEIVEETPVLISSSTLSTAFNHIRYSHYVLYRGKLSWNEQGSVCWTVSSSVSLMKWAGECVLDCLQQCVISV